MECPKIRDIEPVPAGKDSFYLRDPRRISDVVLMVPRPALFIVSLFDGKHSVVDVQAEFARATGEILLGAKVEEIIAALDEALFLDNERFARAQADVIRRFHDSDTRSAIHAGLSYPGEGKELARYLSRLFGPGEAEGESGPIVDRGEPADDGDIEAIVVPHIDLVRGGAGYAAAYRRLASCSRASRFVILGICHHPTLHTFALTRKDYDTPLGRVGTDRVLVDRLAGECRTDFLADEIAHREEHSVEFQLLFLQYLLGGFSELCARRDFSVLPILCSSFHEHVARGEEPGGSTEVSEFIGALGRVLGDRREDCIIAAVDFAHLGRQFGQEITVTDELVRRAEADDRRMMERLAARDAAGFFRLIAEERDRRNVCGVPALYALLRILGSGPEGRTRHYGQAVDRAHHSVVTFAGMDFPRSPQAR